MLVLSRKVGERILIGDQVTVTVVRISGGGVRLGIEAPPEMAVIREELQDGYTSAITPGKESVGSFHFSVTTDVPAAGRRSMIVVGGNWSRRPF
jgi:carbon storage regulator